MDIIYLFKVLLRRKWLILFCLVIGLAGGFVFRLFLPKQYISTAQYSTGFYQTQKVSLQLNENNDVNQIDYRLNNVIETYKSPIVLGMMSYNLMLHDLESPIPFRELKEKDKKDSVFLRADMNMVRQILHEKQNSMKLLSTYDRQEKKVWDLLNLYNYNEGSILGNLTVERVPKTDYINVSFSSENPELSAYVTNAIGTKFKEFYSLITSTSTKESLTKLDSLKESKRKEVDGLRLKLQDYRESIGTPNPGDAATAAMGGVQELTSSLTDQQAKLNDLKNKLSSVTDQLATLNSIPTVAVSTGNHADEILVLRKTNDELAIRLAQKGGNDPDLQKQIDINMNKIIQLRPSTASAASTPAVVNKEVDKKEGLIKEKLDLVSDINTTNENIEMYKGRLADFRKIAFSGGGKEVVVNAYENDLNTAQKDLEKYNSSIFASQDIDVSPDFNFKQILIGQPAIKPEPSHGIMIVAISGLTMFFLASLFIITLELLDSTLRTPSIFQKETKLPILAVVGKIDLRKKSLNDHFDFDQKAFRGQNGVPFIESIRKLRFAIESSGKKVVLVTSAKAQSGKTTIIESLAHTFSMSKKKVLLIDANFSNNSLTRDFGAKPTLENFSLNGHDNGVDKIWSITTLTNITNIDMIGCDEGNYTPSEILPKNNLLTNLEKIKDHYDFIFMEGAALNSHADSKELVEFADGILAVFSAKDDLRETDRESISYLEAQDHRFIGSVLNNVDEQNIDL